MPLLTPLAYLFARSDPYPIPQGLEALIRQRPTFLARYRGRLATSLPQHTLHPTLYAHRRQSVVPTGFRLHRRLGCLHLSRYAVSR